MKFVNQFNGNRETLTHGELLKINALTLAARQDVEALVETLDDSTVAVTFPQTGKTVIGSDWRNVRSAIVGAA